MSLDRMIPDLQASFACEDVRVEASGAHTIVGIVNFIGAPKLPIQIIKLCIWTRWSSGVGEFEQVFAGETVTGVRLERRREHAEVRVGLKLGAQLWRQLRHGVERVGQAEIEIIP